MSNRTKSRGRGRRIGVLGWCAAWAGLAWLGGAAAAEAVAPFAATRAASSVSLAGPWRFRQDNVRPDGSASDFGRLYARPEHLTEANQRDRQGYGLELGYHAADYDDSAWQSLQVPGAWGAQGIRRDASSPYHGPAWYRQRIQVPAEWADESLLLQLGQANQRGTVYWNGEQVAEITAWGPHFRIWLRPEQVRAGALNTVAVRVVNFYRDGGLTGGEFRLTAIRPLVSDSQFQAERMPLSVDQDLPPRILDDPRWSYGWRDEGTADTRPRLSRADGAYQGRPAVAMEVWLPNSTELVDVRLGETENGRIWRERGFDYIAFHVKSAIAGEMQMRLNRGDIRWRRGGPSFRTRFWVEPGDWQRVILPFTAFLQDGVPLTDTAVVDTIAIGYGNNELQSPGTVMFADFQVGHFAVPATARPISLDGLWRFTRDNVRPDGEPSDFALEQDRPGYGEQLGFHQADFDDSGWDAIPVGVSMASQGYPERLGPAWYRRRVVIPAAWAGRPLRLQLGKPDDRGEVFWNGQEVARVASYGPVFDLRIEPGQVRYGEVNTIAVRIHNWYRSGGMTQSPFRIGPEPERIAMRWQGQGEDAERPFADFEKGPLAPVGRTAEVVVRLMAELGDLAGARLDYRLVDCFHATVAVGSAPLAPAADGDLVAVVGLDGEQTRRMYYGEWIDVRGMVLNGGGEPVASFAHHRQRLRYEERDHLSLPPLPEISEDTPFGRLRLVDVIAADAAPEAGPHPYKVGGVRDFWGGRRAYSPWVEGVAVHEFQGRRYREATNNQHFGYRIGRGTMKPGTQYLLRILYPEDKTRYFAMDIKAGRNYQGVGFRTGVAPDNPVTPYPLSSRYEWSDHIVSLDDITYGYRGRRSASAEHGFWVFFHDIGRVYSPQYDAGPAVAEMRLYEIGDPPANYAEIRYPEGLPQRVLMMDWERQPEADPVAVAEYARIIGLNALGPVFQKWGEGGYWDTELGFRAPHWHTISREGERDEDAYRRWLDGTRQTGVTLIPRIEYGGGPKLPRAARVIGPDGKPDRAGRYAQWGANLLHPATIEEIKAILDELIGREIAEYPNLGGVLWRMRSDRVKCSYGRHDIEMFCRETGREMPEGDATAIARWAAHDLAKEYHDWWHRKRRDFHVAIRDHLRSFRPDLKLYYYNWDPDGWSLATGNNQHNTPQDWTDLYNVNRTRDWYNRKIAAQKALTDQDYLARLRGGHPMTDQPHKQMRPELYRELDGIALFLPVHWHYLADNEPYIRSFLTGDGLAVCNQFYYEEKGRTNVQDDNYETSEMTPAGPQFSMAEEVLSFFHGDPNVITWTPYTIGRSFVTEHRRFAQAFLALPDLRGELVATAVGGASAPDVRVRTHPIDDGRVYVSVAHRGFAPARFAVTIPDVAAGATVTNLVTGESVPTRVVGGGLAFEVDSRAMELNSFLIR
jgi:hypothetical protein